jgi:hypothetical protein
VIRRPALGFFAATPLAHFVARFQFSVASMHISIFSLTVLVGPSWHCKTPRLK